MKKPGGWRERGMSPWIIRVLAWIFGGVFVYAGFLKAADPAGFLFDVRSFQILPDPFAAWLALGLPWLEIFGGLAVMTGRLRQGGLLVLNASLLVFLGALLSAWVRDLDVSCGCFGGGGASGREALQAALWRDLVLLALGGFLWMACVPRRGTSSYA